METAERIFDATARIDTLIYIPALGEADCPSEDFTDFVEDLPQRDNAQLYIALPELRRYSDGDYPEVWQVAEILLNRGGFIFNAATPVMEPIGTGSTTSFSWGYYHTEWLYAPNEASMVDVLVAWAEAFHERDKAKKQAA